MCTFSAISLPNGGYRVVMNRDERNDRAPGSPPAWRELAPGLRGIWPTDPQGGGTWIGANDAGMTLALMNLNLDPRPVLPATLRSRGAVIPHLLSKGSPASLLDAVATLDASEFAPFRLAIVDQSAGSAMHVHVVRWDRTRLTVDRHDTGAVCLASSGLGDDRVLVRLPLFGETVVARGCDPRDQDAFHRHAWPDRPELSVLMRRQGHRTVSITTVEMDHAPAGVQVGAHARVRMRYEDVRN